MGVPIVTAPGYEADDVIGTMAKRAAETGFEVAIVSIDKDFFQLVHDGIRVYDPREDGAWFDAAGGRRQVRRRAAAGRRRARAGRRHERQRGGRARRRQEGRDRPDQRPRQPRRAARQGRRAAAEEVPRDAGRASRRGAAQPRAGHDPVRRAARRRLRVAAVPRRVARALLRAVLAPCLPHPGQRIRADRRHDPEGLRARHDARPSSTRSSPSCAPRASSRSASSPTARSSMRAEIVGIAFSTARSPGAVRAAGP